MALVILPENDVSKLLIYLDVYFLCVGILLARSVDASLVSKRIEAFTCRCLLITCANKTSQVPTLKLVAEAALTLPKMFKVFSDMLRFFNIFSLESWLHFGFRIQTKMGFPSSIHFTREFTFEEPSSVLWKSWFSQVGSKLLATEVNSFQLSNIVTKGSILDVGKSPGSTSDYSIWQNNYSLGAS